MPTEPRPSRSDGGAPAAGIWLRPLGSPMPLAFVALGAASLVVAGYDLGWVPASHQLHVGLILVAFAFPLQLVASVIAFLGRDGATATAFGAQAGAWLAIGLVGLTVAPGTTSPALGLLLVPAGVSLLLTTAAVAQTKIVPAVVIGLTGARFIMSGVYELSKNEGWQDLAGVVGLGVVATAAYTALACALEDELGRSALPLLRRGRGRTALEGDPGERSAGASVEPGVRQVL